MDPGCFTLLKVGYIYPLFTEQLTRYVEKHRITVVPLEQKNKQKKGGNRGRKIAEYQFSMVVSAGINSSHFAIMSC